MNSGRTMRWVQAARCSLCCSPGYSVMFRPLMVTKGGWLISPPPQTPLCRGGGSYSLLTPQLKAQCAVLILTDLRGFVKEMSYLEHRWSLACFAPEATLWLPVRKFGVVEQVCVCVFVVVLALWSQHFSPPPFFFKKIVFIN